jgi:hypothetical protein
MPAHTQCSAPAEAGREQTSEVLRSCPVEGHQIEQFGYLPIACLCTSFFRYFTSVMAEKILYGSINEHEYFK